MNWRPNNRTQYRTPVDEILDYILDVSSKQLLGSGRTDPGWLQTTNASLAIACDSDVECILRFQVRWSVT